MFGMGKPRTYGICIARRTHHPPSPVQYVNDINGRAVAVAANPSSTSSTGMG